MLGRPLSCIVLLLVLLDLRAATQQTRDASNKKISPERIVLHSPVPLTPTEHRKLNASIRKLGSDSAEELAKEAYQDKGYFRAEVSAELTPVPATGVHAKALVLQVRPGKQYHLIRISWRGNTAFSESELSALIPFRPGELFNRSKIAGGLSAVQNLYESRGYVNYTPVPVPVVDDAAATIGFEIDIDEGGQYRFGGLEVEGMEEAHREILLSGWQHLRGHPYNVEDADKFFNRFFRSPLPNIWPENYTTRKIDERDHSVSYSLQFAPSLRYRVTHNSQLKLVESP